VAGDGVLMRRATICGCAALVIMTSACGADPSRVERAETTTSDTGATRPPEEAGDLLEAIEATTMRRTAAFDLEVRQALPADVGGAVAITTRHGRFDDETEEGDGTFAVGVDDPEIAEQLGYDFDPFQYRLVDGVYWNLNTVVDPPVWFGGRLEDLEELAGGDPTLGMDGDLFLLLIAGSITEVLDRSDTPSGGTSWVVRSTADDLAPLVMAGGALSRVMEAVPEDTGIEVDVTLVVDAEGMVTGFEVEMDEWWTTVVSKVIDAGLGDLSMSATFGLGGFDEPVTVATPCADPEPVSNPGEPPGMTCEGL
jgi:hypothetical protein